MKTYDITLTVTISAKDTDEALHRISRSVLGEAGVIDLDFTNAKEVK
jgi:hypothetical protein